MTISPGSADELAERIFSSTVAALDLAAIYLGDRLGWYAALAADGAATPDELAERTSSDARYAREWLEQQAVTGILTVNDDGRFALPDGHAAVLVDPTSLSLMAPVTRMVTAAFGRLPAVAAAYRSGAGVGWESYGADMREGQAAFNRPAFTHLLGGTWLPGVADVDAVLRGPRSARMLDVGCGEGWSTIGIARAYPNVRVVGIDLDGPSIDAAHRHATEAGVDDRIEFRHADAADLEEGGYDAAIVIEAVHDMANPVPVLRAIREALVAGGSLIVVDERVAEEFTAPGDELERFMYGWSVTTCLPDGRSHQPSVATGTVMRPATLARYAAEAGFTGTDVLPIENDFFRFYQLRTGA